MNPELSKILSEMKREQAKQDGTMSSGLIKRVFEQATPKKGKDYFTEAEKKELIAEIKRLATPKKNKDYFDGMDSDPKEVAKEAVKLLMKQGIDAKMIRNLESALDVSKLDIEIDAKKVRGIKDLLPKYPPMQAGGSGASFLKSLRDITNTKTAAEGDVLVKRGDKFTFETSVAGSGDVVGPASATDSNFAAFDTTTGKLIKDSTKNSASFAAALGADDNYVTDAEKVVIGNTSGTNTGDQTLPTRDSLGVDTDDTVTFAGVLLSGLTASEIVITDASKNLASAPVATYPSLTELTYVKGVTSAIQTQLGTKITASSTDTLTNKRITKRTGTTTSSATPTINTDNVDEYYITAQTEAITSFTTNLSGTPTLGQLLFISVIGTAARAITWGASFANGPVALPTTTVTTTQLSVLFKWSGAIWRCYASGSTV